MGSNRAWVPKKVGWGEGDLARLSVGCLVSQPLDTDREWDYSVSGNSFKSILTGSPWRPSMSCGEGLESRSPSFVFSSKDIRPDSERCRDEAGHH